MVPDGGMRDGRVPGSGCDGRVPDARMTDARMTDARVTDARVTDGNRARPGPREPCGSRWRRSGMSSSGARVRRTSTLLRTGMAIIAMVGLTAVSGCGGQRTQAVGPAEPTADGTATRPTSSLVPAGYEGRFRTRATVLESPEHGPQLCFAVAESMPPQCEGPDIAGWDWTSVDAESVRGTRWGSYVLVGTFDGNTFTLTEPARADDGTPPASSDEGLETPCPEPEGGWVPPDPDRATQAAFDAAIRTARSTDGFGGVWIDQQIPDEQLTEDNANDPQVLVLNVTTTGDVAEMERAIRGVWGGSLCVSRAPYPMDELAAVQRQLRDLPGLLGSSVDERAGRVDVAVLVAAEELQRDLDQRYGKGAVVLHGALEPID